MGLSQLVIVSAVLSYQMIAWAGDQPAQSADSLDGVWQADVSESQSVVLTIQGTEIEMSAVAGDARLPIWVGKLRLSKEEPSQHMDWVELKSGKSTLPDNKCLFRRRGDVLLVIGGGPGKRPTRFFSGSGGDPKTLVFLRVASKEGGSGAKP